MRWKAKGLGSSFTPLQDTEAPASANSAKREKYDIEAIVKSIMNLSVLMNDFPEIKEIDINPFYVLPESSGGLAPDARIIIAG